MCDYSLEGYRSRPARADERYETRRFPSHTVGIVAPADSETAVCMACDTRLKLEGLPNSLQRDHGIGPDEEATFIRLEAGLHRDGVRFGNGAQASLQAVGPGVRVTVLSLAEAPLPDTGHVHEEARWPEALL